MPPVYFYVLFVLTVSVPIFLPLPRLIDLPYSLLGWIFIVLGVILNFWSDSLFKKKKTTIKPGGKATYLIDFGPFKFSRNPIYLGMTLILLGVVFLFGSPVLFLFPFIFFLLMQQIFIPMEEKEMERSFGKNYVEYKKHVRRWI